MRKIQIALAGALLMAFAFVFVPSLRVAAQNTACSIAQGGSTFSVASGCTISGAGAVLITGRVGIPIGAAPAATCTAGEVFIDTDETSDTNCTTTADNELCLCVATNTWVELDSN